VAGAAAASVVVDYDRRVNFATLKTYSWGPIESSTHRPFAAARTPNLATAPTVLAID
jgi:hypothetical protein